MNTEFLLSASGSGIGNGLFLVISMVMFIGVIYFGMVRPQKKNEEKQAAMLSTIESGDSVLTTAGFYGVVIDVSDDTVIVEFGNNKNCRIPMQKKAIVEVEKANSEV